ncbi:polyprenyl synthetase family protein [Streptomyces sp. NPDC001691]|uniref:polyprenyl synthetase family protein n=1 Tax=Streptomyces sp. NPDC001691 TaxID=3364600 RepID=UPI0036B165E1
MTRLSTTDLEFDVHSTRRAVEQTLEAFLADKERGPNGAMLATPLKVLRHFLNGGGKRVRPLYCCLGWRLVDNAPFTHEVLRAAAGLELFHTFALLHDDLIDSSDSRHDRPTAHHVFRQHGPHGRHQWFGESAAILLGDLCEVWSAELLGALDATAGPRVARTTLDQMRGELVIGQYLDLCASGGELGSVEDALQVIHYKTTKYTVERPLQIGAALAGADQAVLDACAAYALPLGEAFQMYDDLEDVVVDSAKPGVTGNDLREGKHTVVLALALQKATAAQAGRLRELIGNPSLDEDQLAEARALIASTGAPDEVRRLVVERRHQALDILATAPFHPAAKRALARLTDVAVPGVATWQLPEQRP